MHSKIGVDQSAFFLLLSDLVINQEVYFSQIKFLDIRSFEYRYMYFFSFFVFIFNEK